MKFSKIGRMVSALVASAALGLGMTACGGGTIGYMWVLGTFYNQISGFLIDNFTGNLTSVPQTPFASGGLNPVTILVKPGGRFVYVINQGSAVTAPVAASGNSAGTLATQSTAGNISEYSVGGQGVLTFQQTFTSQGIHPMWGTFDSTGNFLYVLDKYAPDVTGNGSITAFSVASDTGRLSLLQNTGIKNPNGTPTTYFSVNANPTMTKLGSGSCLFTINAGSIYPYSVNSTSGQLTLATTGPQVINGAQNLSSINTSASAGFIYLTDSAANQIYSFQAGGTACSLSQINASQTANVATATNPVNSLTSSNGRFLYVINQGSTGGVQAATSSSISAFTIDTLGRLQTLSDSSNPYSVGSGPVCLAQDPSNQYLYTSNNVDSTVTGKIIDQNRGVLSPLTRGSTFPSTMKSTCLVVSGNL
jgi:6-phosphogluconolactonase